MGLRLYIYKNMSEVKELWEGTDEYSYTNWRGVYYVLKVGEPVGMFRIPAANKVMDENSPYYGYNIVNNNGYLSDSNTEYEYVGSSEAKFNMGFNTTLKWKGFTLNASADWRKVDICCQILHISLTLTETLHKLYLMNEIHSSIRIQ